MQGFKTWNVRTYDPQDAVFAPHIHRCCEFLFIRDGSAKITVNQREYFVRAGHLIVIGAMEIHHLEAVDMPYFRTGFYLDPNEAFCVSAVPLLAASLLRHPVGWEPVFDLSGAQELLSLADELHREFHSEQPFRGEMLELLLQRLLIGLYRLYPGRFAVSVRDEMMENARRLLEAECTGTQSVEEIAAGFAFSPSHFIVRFRKYTGHTPYHYRNLCRIARARQLLQTTDLSVKEIADRCGFTDLNGFVRSFRSAMKVPPGEYRRLSMGETGEH